MRIIAQVKRSHKLKQQTFQVVFLGICESNGQSLVGAPIHEIKDIKICTSKQPCLKWIRILLLLKRELLEIIEVFKRHFSVVSKTWNKIQKWTYVKTSQIDTFYLLTALRCNQSVQMQLIL